MPLAGLADAVPVDSQSVIGHCLEKEPERRYERARRYVLRSRRSMQEPERLRPSGAHSRCRTKPVRANVYGAFVAALGRGFVALSWSHERPVSGCGSPGGHPGPRNPSDPSRSPRPSASSDIRRFPPTATTWRSCGRGPDRIMPTSTWQMLGAGSPVGAPLRLTTDSGSDQNPVWSPDGRWIAFLNGQPRKVSC